MEQSEYDDIIKICTTLDTHSSASCVSGLVTGLVEYGPINQEHILGFNFCTSKILAEDERLNCFNSVIVNTSFIYSEAELVVVCDLVAKEVDIQKIPMCV
jgi:hypothetical protein